MTKTKKQIKLPSKPSELILLALKDLRAVEKSKKYVVEMGEWHTPDYRDGKCAVCLAGAVMAKTLKVSVHDDMLPYRMGINDDKLRALDYFREGYVQGAFRYLGITVDWPDKKIAVYEHDAEAFHADMQQLAADLKAAGL